MGSSSARECPTCQALCPASAELCYRCKKKLPFIAAVRLGDDERAAITAAVTAGVEVSPRAGQPGKIGKGFVVTAGVAAVSFVVSMALDGQEGAAHGAMVVAIMGCVIGAIVAACLLATDLLRRGPRGRKQPAHAARAFLGQLAAGRGRAALACMSPLSRTRPIAHPGGSGDIVLDSPEAAAAYHKALVGKRRFARLTVVRCEAEPVNDALTILRVQARLDSHPWWTVPFLLLALWPGVILMVAFARQRMLSCEVAAHPGRGQWWVVFPGLGDWQQAHRPAAAPAPAPTGPGAPPVL